MPSSCHGPCEGSIACLALLLLLMALVVPPCACTPTVGPLAEPARLPSNVTVCYLIPRIGRESGFSIDIIVGARKADEQLRIIFANSTVSFRMKTFLNQSVTHIVNRSASMISHIEKDGCTVIISTGPRMWDGLKNGSIDQLSGMYPSVQFLLLSDYTPALKHPNAHFVSADLHPMYFALGAAAAVACSSCVGFYTVTAAHGLATMFHRGMQFGQQFRGDGANVTELCPLLVFRGVDQFFAESDIPFTRAMHARGCSVVVYYAVVQGAQVIQREQLTTPAGRSMFSMTIASDGTLFIGDTVLASFYLSPQRTFVRFLQSHLSPTPFVSGIIPHGATLGSVSPLAPLNVSVAMHAAAGAYASGNGSIVWCTPIYTPAGALLNPVVNGTMQCVLREKYQLLPFVERGIAQHPMLAPPSTCVAGSYARYSALTDLSLTCVPCPAGTYAAARGQLSCAACPAGLQPASNRTACKPPAVPADAPSSTLTVVLLAVLLPTVCAAACCLAYAVMRRRWAEAASEIPAPCGPQVALAMIQVDDRRSSKSWRKQIVEGAYVFELLRHSVHAAAAEHRVYMCFATPSAFVMAADTPEQLVELAEDVEQALVTHSDAFSTCFISIAGAVAFGPAESRPNASFPGKTEYFGPLVGELMKLRKAASQRSGLWLPASLLNRLVASDPSLKLRVQATLRSSTDPNIPPTQQAVQAVALRFRFIPAPGQREEAEAMDERGLATSSSSLVVQRGQKETLRAIFHTIASRFLFAAPAKDQRKVAHSLAKRFHIHLVPRPALPQPAGAPPRCDELRQMIPLVTPFVLNLMDEMSVREHIQAMGLAQREVTGSGEKPDADRVSKMSR